MPGGGQPETKFDLLLGALLESDRVDGVRRKLFFHFADYDLVDDAVQQGLLYLLEANADSPSPDGPFEHVAQAFVCFELRAAGWCKDHLRKAGRATTLDGGPRGAGPSAPPDDLAAGILRDDRGRILRECREALDDGDRSVLADFFDESPRRKDVIAGMGVHRATAYRSRRKALEKLRGCLEGRGLSYEDLAELD